VTQARSQAARGEFVAAATSVERALRIEPDNPLVWLELGRIRLAAGEAAQAENLARKALALASGSSSTQAEAWRLIAESYRARDRNVDARDAEQRARALGP
jgi:Flp pilus assembly protein TadD